MAADQTTKRLDELMDAARHWQAQGQVAQAINAWRTILLAQPDHVPALLALGRTLLDRGRLAEAEATLRVAVERAPHSGDIWALLADILIQWGSAKEAEDCLYNAVARQPDNPDIQCRMGWFKLEAGAVMEAMAAFQTASDAAPDKTDALIGLAEGRRRQGQWDEATRCLRRAAMVKPDDPDIGFHLARALLAQGLGDEEAWPLFEGRPGQTVLPKIPHWDGSPLNGRTLLVNHEGGLCEAIQFGRLAPMIGGGRVVYRCPAEIYELLHGAHWDIEFVSDTFRPPRADVQASLLNLPALVKLTRDTLPKQVPYLRADPTRLAPWRKRLGNAIRVGLAWQGGERPYGAGQRGLPLDALHPLADIKRIQLFSLQKGEGRQALADTAMPIDDLDPELDEGADAFLDTAAAISNMTLVITTDSVIAHLAGALGKPVWVLLPHGPQEWRWQSQGRDTPWYPTMDLFACESPGDWTGLANTLARRLRMMIDGFDPDA